MTSSNYRLIASEVYVPNFRQVFSLIMSLGYIYYLMSMATINPTADYDSLSHVPLVPQRVTSENVLKGTLPLVPGAQELLKQELQEQIQITIRDLEADKHEMFTVIQLDNIKNNTFYVYDDIKTESIRELMKLDPVARLVKLQYMNVFVLEKLRFNAHQMLIVHQITIRKLLVLRKYCSAYDEYRRLLINELLIETRYNARVYTVLLMYVEHAL